MRLCDCNQVIHARFQRLAAALPSLFPLDRRYFVVIPVAIGLFLSGTRVVLSKDRTPMGAGASNLAAVAAECRAGSGWMWTDGPLDSTVAAKTEQALEASGIDASVIARQYGETDACGNFDFAGIDFDVQLKGGHALSGPHSPAPQIAPILEQYGQPRVGNMRVTDAFGNTVLLPHDKLAPAPTAHGLVPQASQAGSDYGIFLPFVSRGNAGAAALARKVYVIAYDPVLSNGESLSEYLHWYSRDTLTQQTIDFFKDVTDNRLEYNVVATTVVTDEWPVKIDGFRYDENSYLDVIQDAEPPHSPNLMDYAALVNSDRFDICGKANRGEIEEVWVYNGPFFGFYESTLVGADAYWLNSPPVPGLNNCHRPIPIMGPSPQRELDCAIEDFGHRAESAMNEVYGWLQLGQTSNNWEKFALVQALSPTYSYSGCGTVHYPPNGAKDYDYANPAGVWSNCDDFFQYPNLGNAAVTAHPVTCTDWNCSHLDYFRYWFTHFPGRPGCASDKVSSDWWQYVADPALALDPTAGCEPMAY